MPNTPAYEFVFDQPFDDYAQTDAKDRGYLPNVKVKTPGGGLYVVTFYDHVRLAQDIEEEKIIVEPGLIVVHEITLDVMHQALTYMLRTNYFSCLKPQLF